MSGRLNVDGRVSVILATYNGEKYVERAIRNILDQTYKDVELIVVDDGSNDGTRNVTSATLDRLPDYTYPLGRTRIYHTNGPNHFTPMGGLWPYLVGAGNSTGEYLSFHSQDDWSEPDRIEKLVAAIGDRSLAYSNVRHVTDSGATIKISGCDMNEAITAALHEDSDFIPHVIFSSSLFRKDVFFRRQAYLIGQYNYEWLITMKMYDKDGFAYVPQPLYNYMEHAGQCSRLGPRWPEIVRSTGYHPENIWYGRYNYGEMPNRDLKAETMERVKRGER